MSTLGKSRALHCTSRTSTGAVFREDVLASHFAAPEQTSASVFSPEMVKGELVEAPRSCWRSSWARPHAPRIEHGGCALIRGPHSYYT